MAITYEETIQTVLNLIQEREKLRIELDKLLIEIENLKAENVRLSDELTSLKELTKTHGK